jgi:hypothetical protein
MSIHSETVSWFRANQSLLFPINDACLATNTYFIVIGMTRSGLEPTIYHSRGEHLNYYITNAVIFTGWNQDDNQ